MDLKSINIRFKMKLVHEGMIMTPKARFRILFYVSMMSAIFSESLAFASPDHHGVPIAGEIALSPSVKQFRAKMITYRWKLARNAGFAAGLLVPVGVLTGGVAPSIAAGTLGSALAFSYGVGTFAATSMCIKSAFSAFTYRKPIKEIRKMKRILQGAQAFLEDTFPDEYVDILESRDAKKKSPGTNKRAKIMAEFEQFYSSVDLMIKQASTSEWDLEYYSHLYANEKAIYDKIKNSNQLDPSTEEFFSLVPQFSLMVKIAEELSFAKEVEETLIKHEDTEWLSKVLSEAKQVIFYLRKPLLGVRGVITNLEKFRTFLEFQLKLRQSIKPVSRKELALILTRPYVYFHATFREFTPLRQDHDPHMQELRAWVVEHLRFLSLLKLIAIPKVNS